MPKSVQLTHPTGASLAISESLSTFLLNRPTRGSPFFLGDWLASIDDAALDAYFSDRGRLFQADRGRRFSVIVDA